MDRVKPGNLVYFDRMIAQFFDGLIAYFRALSFISKRGVGKYFIYSGLIGLVLFAVCGYIVYEISPLLSGLIQSLSPWDIDIDFGITNVFSVIISSVAFLSIFKYLMLIATAPLMSALSERVEQEITGYKTDRGVIVNILPDLLRSLRVNVRNIVRELFLTVVILLLGLFPIIGLVSGLMIILVQSYFAGFGNFDFWAERHFTYRETVRFMKGNKGMMIGNGIVYVFLLALPVIGAFLGPPLATIAATLEGTRELEQFD